ncbi:hypothetical protein AGOR_G00002510 [Albula goreensis]|uniref:Hyaluronan and proteoglycan link protein 3 n=1 Tax=Albula goreensis TaxID=1534307 RepID=A0A8T3E3S6_9TELE|nr:hypothetical protein AGOR_G00002510 [Albula goreensis]
MGLPSPAPQEERAPAESAEDSGTKLGGWARKGSPVENKAISDHHLYSSVFRSCVRTTMVVMSRTRRGHCLLACLVQLQLLSDCLAAERYSNGFYYDDNGNGNGKKEIYYNGVRLHVEAAEAAVYAVRGSTAVLPCRYWYEPALSTPRRTRVKWFWQAVNGPETEVLVSMGSRHRSYGGFKGRVRLRRPGPGEASLVIDELRLNDTGRYRCEVIDGLEDQSATVELALRGVVFPYQLPGGRYQLNFHDAQKVCEGQDSALATFEQLFWAWEEGLDWCNAGWLADGTVQYPVTSPREPCGGSNLAPGIRSYGPRHRELHYFDAFCFSSSLTGHVYFLSSPNGLNFTEALQECERDGAQIAKVGQLYASWRFADMDSCDAGWLADGSLRYPIIQPRPNCGPPEPGVRNFGFPSQSQKHGVYCYLAD